MSGEVPSPCLGRAKGKALPWQSRSSPALLTEPLVPINLQCRPTHTYQRYQRILRPSGPISGDRHICQEGPSALSPLQALSPPPSACIQQAANSCTVVFAFPFGLLSPDVLWLQTALNPCTVPFPPASLVFSMCSPLLSLWVVEEGESKLMRWDGMDNGTLGCWRNLWSQT